MKHPLSATLGTADELTATQARAMALAEIEAARAKRAAGPLFRDFADEFTRRQSRRWKPATRDSNRTALNNQILPFFGDMRLADIDRADVARWFDSLSATPAMPTARSRLFPPRPVAFRIMWMNANRCLNEIVDLFEESQVSLRGLGMPDTKAVADLYKVRGTP